jgi:Tol biopolymer transport system component
MTPTGRLVPLLALAACSPESDAITVDLRTHAFTGTEWAAPVNLGPAINSSANDQNASLSRDGLSLYFVSNRPGGLGGTDLWVSRRACPQCPWETPRNLALVKSSVSDGGPNLSQNGRLLFFHSSRTGGHGQSDLWVSRRRDRRDDLAWGVPVNLGPGVNTEINEFAPEYLESGEQDHVNLYFSRGETGALQDIYRASIAIHRRSDGEAELVIELSDPDANDAAATVRNGGRELLFWSTRAGGLGGADIWISTRRARHRSWSTPQNLGEPVNGPFDDQRPSRSTSGRTLLFDSDRPGGHGGQDIWMSNRTQSAVAITEPAPW